jgi:tetratricopeptide (TPR) repeat protein
MYRLRSAPSIKDFFSKLSKGLKMHYKITNLLYPLVLGFLFFITSCAVSGPQLPGPTEKEPQVDQEDIVISEEEPEPQEGEISEEQATPSPRALASLRLTDQGRELVEKGRPDDAIRILERAITLNSSNGQNYYYLAEAWLMKGVLRQASEFNQLAEQYLKGDPKWEDRVLKQKEKILEKTL